MTVTDLGSKLQQGQPKARPVRRRRVGRFLVAGAVIIVLAVAAYFAYQRFLAPPPAAAAPQATAQVRRGTIQATVNSTGTVATMNQAKVAFGSSGTITQVSAKVGDTVTKGQTLAALDTSALQLAVAQAQGNLSIAQAKLAIIKQGTSAADIKVAQAQLDVANAKLNEMLAGNTAEDIAAAQASLDSAKLKLADLKAPPADSDVKAAEQGVISAQAAVVTAQNNLATLKAGATSADIKAAQVKLDQAKNSLWSSQTSRDGTCVKPNEGSPQCKSANISVANAELSLQQAQDDLANLMAPPKDSDIAADQRAVDSAQAGLTSAQAKLALVKAGATDSQLKDAEIAVTQAQLALEAKQKPYTNSDMLSQRQAVASAEANLALKQTPYTDADILSAQAAVDQAQASLDTAKYNLANAAIVSPLDGAISAVSFNVGEAGGTGSTITIVDPKNVRLDTTVDETDIGQLAVGEKSTITFDSIPGKVFSGTVTAVAPSAVMQSGVATYLVSIGIANSAGIRPGMTGNAVIVYNEKTNVLTVPNRAIRSQGRNRVVDVVVNGKTETRQVAVGLANDTLTEVTAGVAEGDRVVITGTTAALTGAGRFVGGGFGGGPVRVGD